MFYYLDIEQQLKRILSRIKFKNFKDNKVSSSNELNDICDGRYYKSLLDSDDGHLFRNNYKIVL